VAYWGEGLLAAAITQSARKGPGRFVRFQLKILLLGVLWPQRLTAERDGTWKAVSHEHPRDREQLGELLRERYPSGRAPFSSLDSQFHPRSNGGCSARPAQNF